MAVDQRCEPAPRDDVETRLGVGDAHGAVDVDRPRDALHGPRAQRFEVDVSLDEPAGGVGEHHCARRRRALQARRDVGRLADDVDGLTPRAGTHLTDDDDAGVDPDACRRRREIWASRRDACHGAYDLEPGPHGAGGVVLVGDRMAEEHEQAVADVADDHSAVGLDDRRRRRLVREDEGAQLLGIERFGERRGADEIDEDDGQLATLRVVGEDARRQRRAAATAEPEAGRILEAAASANHRPSRPHDRWRARVRDGASGGGASG
jgi:hypothetical protein